MIFQSKKSEVKPGQVEGAGATELLREDHRKVKEIFDEFERTEETAAKRRLVESCLIELSIHAKIEEELFYPAARKADPELIDEAEEEHHVAKLLISELCRMKPSDDRYDAKFSVLSESVKHHIEEEEGELFPKFEKSGVDLETLGQEMAERKMRLMEEVSLESIREEINIVVASVAPAGAAAGRGSRNTRSRRNSRGSRSRRVSGRRTHARAKA
jgi:hemerythrin superfamily protein